MYTLYWHPYASSLAPMAVLEELGVPFRLHQVDYDGGETRTPEYLTIQPLGLIPAMRLGDGSTMFESAAIIQYLCDRHTHANLSPTTGDPERPRYLQWMYFMADTIYPSYNRFYHPERYTAAADGADGVKQQARDAALKQWQVVENALRQRGPWLLGERFSSCDIYLQMITTWHESPGDLFSLYPAIHNLAKRVVRREKCQRAIQRHKFQTGMD